MTRFRVFLLCLTVWTVALLVRVPSKPFGANAISERHLKFYVSKAVHVGGYAFLTAFVAVLPISRAKRLGLVLLLSLHGFASEFMQAWVTSYRSGSFRDVGLDHLGILLGLILTRHRWRRPANDRLVQPTLAPVEDR